MKLNTRMYGVHHKKKLINILKDRMIFDGFCIRRTHRNYADHILRKNETGRYMVRYMDYSSVQIDHGNV